MINILFIIHRLSYGGAEKILTFLANKLSIDGGFRVYIYTYEDTCKYHVLHDAVSFIGENDVAKMRFIRRFKQVIQMKRVIKRVKPDIIISFLTMSNFLSVLAGKLTYTPVIISERGDPYQYTSFWDKIFCFINSFADGAVFQTDAARKFYPRRLQKKSTVIANPVFIKDESVIANLDSPANEIAFVARFEIVQKRQDIMVQAFKIVNEKYPEMVLKFYGDGPDLDYVKNMVESMGLKDKVIFMGLSNNPTKDISNARVFVLSSDYEGIPNALIEAMAIGMPVVSTDCSPGGARLLIENEVNGLLVPAGDYLAIAQAIIRYIENPDFARQCGNAAKQIKTKYAPEKIINQWKEYVDVICRRQA
ncbi:glycosyltransferase [Desulfolucanica intricata]|uniref:glycosyltransferase n=1 Tax=Desulfolucanica intricata TaxID=1285191 RepID=UPI00082A5E7D|nr:glycosyltransferase [Desulfolucanica intricata]